MPQWKGSTRRDRLPADWPKIRKRILRRDGRVCQWLLSDDPDYICGMPANQVDHKIPNDDDSDENLQALCYDHHLLKSSREGAQALHAKRREINQRFQITEEHPGLM